jgi:hypothetical protein
VLLASGCFHLFVAAKSNFPTETGVRWVLWYFPMRPWDMAPGLALEIPRCCRYGDQLEFEFVVASVAISGCRTKQGRVSVRPESLTRHRT